MSKNNSWSWASNQGLYNTPQWKSLRELKIDNDPLCELCRPIGRLTPATEIDHIKSISESNYQELFLDYDNLQSLCNPCHRFKTNRDKGDKNHLYEGDTGNDLIAMLNDL